MGHKPQGPDIFALKQGYVECISGTGHMYKVTHDSCSCKGFGFRKLCRHYRQAQQKGFLDQLEKQISSAFNGCHSQYIKTMRVDAIKLFLDKHRITYTLKQVFAIEKTLTQSTSPQEVFGFFF